MMKRSFKEIYLIMKIYIKCVAIFFGIISCIEYKNFFITLGDNFVDKAKENMYFVGYMIDKHQAENVNDNLLKITFNDKKKTVSYSNVSKCQDYIYNGSTMSNKVESYVNRIPKIEDQIIDPIISAYLKSLNIDLKNQEKVKDAINKAKAKTLNYSRKFCFHSIKSLVTPNFTYELVGSDQKSLSKIFSFESQIQTVKEPNVLVIGDQDIHDNFKAFMDTVKSRSADLLIHLGDFSYEFMDFNGFKGDHFFEELQDIITKIPFVFSPGNHEAHDSFEMIRKRYQIENSVMSDISDYHFLINETLFVSYDVFYMLYRKNIWPEQQKFYKQFDLTDSEISTYLREKLNKIVETSKPKWLVYYNHYPFYCNFYEKKKDKGYVPNCSIESREIIKVIENVLNEFNFNIRLGAHVHGYERMSLVKDDIEVEGIKDQVYIVLGNGWASDTNPLEVLVHKSQPYSKYYLNRMSGFSTLKLNEQNLHWNHLDLNGIEIDSYVITKQVIDVRNFKANSDNIPKPVGSNNGLYISLGILILLSIIVILLIVHKLFLKNNQRRKLLESSRREVQIVNK